MLRDLLDNVGELASMASGTSRASDAVLYAQAALNVAQAARLYADLDLVAKTTEAQVKAAA